MSLCIKIFALIMKYQLSVLQMIKKWRSLTIFTTMSFSPFFASNAMPLAPSPSVFPRDATLIASSLLEKTSIPGFRSSAMYLLSSRNSPNIFMGPLSSLLKPPTPSESEILVAETDILISIVSADVEKRVSRKRSAFRVLLFC